MKIITTITACLLGC